MEWTSAQLRSLVELTRRGTITAVADALGYTPGGVSQQLSTLERAAGMPLLRRMGRRVELTDAGNALANVRHQVTDTAASLALVEAGVGVTPVTDLMTRLRPARLRVITLAEQFERHIIVIVRAAGQARPTISALIDVLRELTRTPDR